MVVTEAAPPTPGHAVPVGVELTSEDAVQAWLSTMGYGTTAVSDGGETYAGVLVAMGYDNMYTLNFTEEELVEVGVKKPHARAEGGT